MAIQYFAADAEMSLDQQLANGLAIVGHEAGLQIFIIKGPGFQQRQVFAGVIFTAFFKLVDKILGPVVCCIDFIAVMLHDFQYFMSRVNFPELVDHVQHVPLGGLSTEMIDKQSVGVRAGND